MKFRQADKNDISSLNKLVNSAYRGETSKKGWTTEAELLDGIRTDETSLEEMINRSNAVILIAETGNDIEGCVFLEKQADKLYLGMLTVKPELQGKGIGAKLMAASELHAKQLGCNKISMTVITVRDTLISYYQRKGYKATGEKKPFPSDPKFGIPKQPLEFLVMEKAIS